MHTNLRESAAPAHARAQPHEFKVRIVEERDIPALLAIGRELHRENGLMPLSEQRILDITRRGVNRDRIIFGAIGPIGDPEAITILMVGQFWYSDYPHLEEVAVYVKPEFRRSTRAKSLVEFAKKCACELHVPLLIGIVSNKQTEAKVRLYRRQLGEPAGAYFIYNGRTGF